MVLHETEPLKVVGLIWNVFQEQVRLTLEERKDSSFL